MTHMVADSGKAKAIKISDEKTIHRFQKVKDYLGLENDSEVLRFLVNEFLRRVEKKPVFVDVDSDAEVFEEVKE